MSSFNQFSTHVSKIGFGEYFDAKFLLNKCNVLSWRNKACYTVYINM